MKWQARYELAKQRLLSDLSFCPPNRTLFQEFFDFEEYKLKRKNGLPNLDEPSYKTVYEYVRLLRNVNSWFDNKPWRDLTRDDIKRVYDDLEDGRITTEDGKPIKDRASYYNKVLRSKPFRIVGKSELARDVIEFYIPRRDQEVRFVTEETFRRIVGVIAQPEHLLLFWLAWDLGENVNALLKLDARDFTRSRHRQTHEPEYLVNLPQEKIKRSRQSRTEPTLYPETVRYADIILAQREPDQRVFSFEYAQAWKMMSRAAKKSRATCMPTKQPARWKDLRSGMASHLLKKGWRREEVDARLGHTPNSSALNAYINYLAIDREQPKKRHFDSSLEEIQDQLEEGRSREKLIAQRLARQQDENQLLKSRFDELQKEMHALTSVIKQIRKQVA